MKNVSLFVTLMFDIMHLFLSFAMNITNKSMISDTAKYNYNDNTPQASSQCSPRGVTF